MEPGFYCCPTPLEAFTLALYSSVNRTKKIITEVMGSVTENKLNLTEVLSFHYYYKIDVVFFPSGEIFLHFLSLWFPVTWTGSNGISSQQTYKQSNKNSKFQPLNMIEKKYCLSFKPDRLLRVDGFFYVHFTNFVNFFNNLYSFMVNKNCTVLKVALAT